MKTRKLLGTNTKLSKDFGAAANYLATGLTLAPHGISGHQVCGTDAADGGATVDCRAACLAHFSGRRVMPMMRDKALADTKWLFADRPAFLAQLNREIALHVRRAEKRQLTPIIRLNVGSDLDWTEVIRAWPLVQFYDYTKIKSRFRAYLAGQLPANYALTYSASETSTDETLGAFLRAGGNVAMVFAVDWYPAVKRIGPLPASVRVDGTDWPIVDGDKHDIRLTSLDGSSVVVGLRLKGTNASKARGRAHGFAR